MRSESCLKELLWVQASSAGVYVQIAVTASVQDPPGLPVLVSAMEEKMDLDRELREFVKPYGVHFGLQNDPGLPGAIVDLVSVFLYNNNLAPTDDELIHMSTVATMQFAKSWKKGRKRRLDR